MADENVEKSGNERPAEGVQDRPVDDRQGAEQRPAGDPTPERESEAERAAREKSELEERERVENAAVRERYGIPSSGSVGHAILQAEANEDPELVHPGEFWELERPAESL